MDLLEALSAKVTNMTRAQFARAHQGFYLFGRFPEAERPGSGFTTAVVSMGDMAKRKRVEPERFLRRVEKADDNLWRDRISVGRAKSNDICLRHSTISKLHAHFYPKDIEKPWLGLEVMDAESVNGTMVNDSLLTNGERRGVGPGDRITFGGVECRLLDEKGLHATLLDLRSGFGDADTDF